MPIFEKIRAQDQVPCAFPIHMGAGGTVFVRCNTSRSVPLSPHVLHCHPTTHWVSRTRPEEADGSKPHQVATGPVAGGTTKNTPSPTILTSNFLPSCQVRERSVRSIPMSRPSRSSLSASTPDSLSDNEGSHGGPSGRYTPRKVTYTSTRTGLTPGGSRAGSKPNSRPLSRQGSKPPSRHGSTLSLDSTGECLELSSIQRLL